MRLARSLVVILVAGVIGMSCDDSEPRIVAAQIETVDEVEPGVLSVIVLTNSCETAPTLIVSEHESGITLAAEATHSGAGDCDDVGLETTITHELSEPVGDREIVVRGTPLP